MNKYIFGSMFIFFVKTVLLFAKIKMRKMNLANR